jgi:hypothetical protein
MPRLETSPVELVVRAGRFAEGTAYLSLDDVGDLGAQGSQYLYICLEPVDDSPLAGGVADEVIQRLRSAIANAGTQAATTVLQNAIEDVNHWLIRANAIRTSDRRVTFGFTCVLSRDDDIYMAQAAPSQVLIAQEGELYAFPELEDWQWNHDSGNGYASTPLGLQEKAQPELFHTRVEEHDVIVLCSTSLARVLHREPQDVFVHGEGDEILAYLDEISRTYGIEDAHAAAIVVPHHHRPRRTRESTDVVKRLSNWCYHLLPEETAERLRRGGKTAAPEVDPQSQDVHNVEYSAEAPATDSISRTQHWDEYDEPVAVNDDRGDRTGYFVDASSETASDTAIEDNEYWYPEGASPADQTAEEPHERYGRGRTLTELLAGVILAFSAAVVGVWQLTINRDRPIDGPRDDGTLGLPRLNRYDDSMHMPDLTSIRRRLPRTPFNRLTAIVAVVLVAILATGLVLSIRSRQQNAHTARIETAFDAAVAQRQQAEQATDPVVANAFLLAAQQSMRDAVAAGLDPIRSAQQQEAIATDLDTALKVNRLAGIQIVGGVPAAPAGVMPHLFFGNGQLYVFTDALYRLDSNGTTLVRLIGSGDKVGDATTGTLEGAAWGDGSPIVFDGGAVYAFDPTTATWTRNAVGTFGSPHAGIVSTSGYSGNLYLLKPDSAQILKFSSGSLQSQPEDWASGMSEEPELKNAVDMSIDGHIFVLLKDGRILDLYQSVVNATVTPTNVTPAITDAVALSEQTDRPYFYIADGQGRLVRINRDGTLVQQFKPKAGEPSFSGIKTIAVDDGTSTAYLLTDKGLLTVRLPGPPQTGN